MASAIMKLKEAIAPSRDIVADIENKLGKARADLAAAERQHRVDALEAATNVSGANARLEASTAATRAARQRIADLEAAKGEAETQQRANEQRTKAAEHAARLAAFSKELKACDDDAAAVQDLLETLAARWASLLKHRNTAHNVAQQRLDGLLFDAHSLERAFQLCVDRVNLRTEERQRLPGGLAAKAIINPSDVALGLTERLRQANARALEIVQGTHT